MTGAGKIALAGREKMVIWLFEGKGDLPRGWRIGMKCNAQSLDKAPEEKKTKQIN